MPFSASIFAFSGSVVLAGLMANRCLTSPNPPPSNSQNNHLNPDIGRNRIAMAAIRVGFLIFSFLHATVALTYPSPPLVICPRPEHLHPYLFSWTFYTTSGLVLLFGAGTLRMLTYATLDKDFTFELAAPRRLVTSGVYYYVQHPSYTTLTVVWAAFLVLYLRQNGVVGCWLPSVMVGWPGADVIVLGLCVSLWVRMFWKNRVKQEEEMLKNTFGKEWEVWHARTRRFVPGLI
ncbi:MAG: hypothetical protein M1836_003466 [Candelina mexicana]|nr:MAG: hypothetical protein M1836_003466 [Candelina mexicana]